MPTQPTGLEDISQLGAVNALTNVPMRSVTYTASRTLGVEDIGVIVYMNSGSANSVTVLAESAMTKPFRPNTVFSICQDGAGATTIVASGVTIRAAPGGTLVLGGAGAYATLIYRGGDIYDLFGNIAV